MTHHLDDPASPHHHEHDEDAARLESLGYTSGDAINRNQPREGVTR